MSAARAKGTAAESAVVAYLQAMGFAAERRAMTGARDRGDISGLPGIVVEVKNQRTLDLDKYLDEANREAANDPAAVLGVTWHKRRMRGSPGDWYVTMDGHAFVQFLRAWTSMVALVEAKNGQAWETVRGQEEVTR